MSSGIAPGGGRHECRRRAGPCGSLVLALGQHDPDYVDAFYGPPEWKTQEEKEKKSLDAIGAEAAELQGDADEKFPTPEHPGDELLKLRREYLQKQVAALATRVRMLKGEKLKFDDESRTIYDAVAPTFPNSHFDQIIAQVEAKIPGKGTFVGALRDVAQAVCGSEGKTRCRVSSLRSRNAAPGRWRTLLFRLTRVSPSSAS